MPEQQIEELKNVLRLIVQLVATRGQPLNDDLKLMLGRAIEHVAERIQQLREEATPPSPPADLKMERPFPSAQVHSFDYDPKNQNLYVRFQDKYPNQNGPVYEYSGISPHIFELLRRGGVAPTTTGKNRWHAWKKGVTPSLGAVMNHVIKAGGYPYQRLT